MKVLENEFEFGSALLKYDAFTALKGSTLQLYLGSWRNDLHRDGFVVKVVEPALEGFDFGFAHLGGLLVPEEEAYESGREVDRVAALGLHVNEYVAAEQGLIDPLRAVAPAALDALGGAVDGEALSGELVGKFFLPAGFGVNH